MAYKSELGDTFGLPTFVGEPIIITRRDDAPEQIAALEEGTEWFVRPTTVIAPLELDLPEVLRITTAEHQTMNRKYGVPVVAYTFGFIEIDDGSEIAELYRDDPIDHQTHAMPNGLQLAARVRVVHPDHYCGPPEDREDPFAWTDTYWFTPSDTHHIVVDYFSEEQYAFVDNMRPMLVDIEPRIDAQTWLGAA